MREKWGGQTVACELAALKLGGKRERVGTENRRAVTGGFDGGGAWHGWGGAMVGGGGIW